MSKATFAETSRTSFEHQDLPLAMLRLKSQFSVEELDEAFFELVDKGYIEPCDFFGAPRHDEGTCWKILKSPTH